MSFVGDLMQAKPPLIDVETNLIIFHTLLKFKVHFLKVTRVITLAPHDVHPHHSTERVNAGWGPPSLGPFQDRPVGKGLLEHFQACGGS